MYSPSSLLNPTSDLGGAPQIGAPILYVVRHAQNDDDAQDKIRGLHDQPLNETGEKQLGALRAFFSDRPVLGVWTDDLSRTRATANAIAGVCRCGVETDVGLRSWDVGSKLEGRSMAAHKLEIQDFKVHPSKIPTGGQSWADFEDKAGEAIERAIRRSMESSGPLCIVTHGSVIQLFFQRYGDLDENADYDHTPLDQAGVAAMYLTRDGTEVKILKGEKSDLDE